MQLEPRTFAAEWNAARNTHDMDRILAHYADDVEISSPMIKLAAGIDNGSLKGKEAVAAYWKKALERIPDLRCELIDVTAGVDSLALYYHSVMNKRSVEVMLFNAAGKVQRIMAHYS